MNTANEVADAVRAWRPGDPVIDFLATRVAKAIIEMDELCAIREAQRSAVVDGASKALQVLSPPASVDAIVEAAANTTATRVQLALFELANERSIRQNLRLAADLSRRPAIALEQALRLPGLPNRFDSDKKCAKYLRQWQRSRDLGCPVCGARSLYDVFSRAKFECESCRHQFSIRADTIMAGSKISLQVWFAAIQTLLCHPQISVNLLSDHLGSLRPETARQLKNRIFDAQSSPHRAVLLAGLDDIFSPAPALSAPSDTPPIPEMNLFGPLPNSLPRRSLRSG